MLIFSVAFCYSGGGGDGGVLYSFVTLYCGFFLTMVAVMIIVFELYLVKMIDSSI